MNKKLAETAKSIALVIAIIFVFGCLIVISSQFAIKHGVVKAELSEADITLAEILCIKVIKPRPVSTLVAQK